MKEKVRVLIIEDHEDLALDAQREIRDAFEESAEVEVDVAFETDFDAGFEKIRRGESDVVVLDVRRDMPNPSPGDETAGHTVYLELRDALFSPVIFWTALPESVMAEQMAPLVTVVTKDDIHKLPTAIQAAIDSRAGATIAGIEQHVATVLRKHMWAELAPNWNEYTSDADSADIATVLLSRLTRVLEEDREHPFTAHPSHRYVYPPASDSRGPGDIVRSADQTWWIVLTPACDFEQAKVEYVLMALASPLEGHPKYQKWDSAQAGSNAESNKWENLRQDVLMATHGRFHYLPAFRDIPDLVIDLERVNSVDLAKLATFTPVASLVSPFAEALLVQNSHFRGRIGVPDMDASLIKARLKPEVDV